MFARIGIAVESKHIAVFAVSIDFLGRIVVADRSFDNALGEVIGGEPICLRFVIKRERDLLFR